MKDASRRGDEGRAPGGADADSVRVAGEGFRRHPGETREARVGVPTLTCRHPAGVTQPHKYGRVALLAVDRLVGARRSKGNRTTLTRPRRIFP